MSSIAKSPDALKTIREVADQLSLEPYVLRFWEKEFKQVKPMQRGSGRRYYRKEDVEVIRKIQILLHEQGYTIKGARAALASKSTAITAPVHGSENSNNVSFDDLENLHNQVVGMRAKISNII